MFFTEEKANRYLKDLSNYIYQDEIDINSFKYIEGNPAGAWKPDYDDKEWPIFQVGSFWGGKDKTFWFRTEIEIPIDWQNKKLALYLAPGRGQEEGLDGSESLVFIAGQPVQGLDRNHKEVYLKPEWLAKGKLQIALKAFSGLQEGLCFFKKAALVKINEVAEDFYYRAYTILATLKVLKKESNVYQSLIVLLNNSINILDFRKPGSENFYSSIKKANDFLKSELKDFQKKDNSPVITAVGHSHIDVAWLWRLCHTREKCSRTFATVDHLMDQYPEYQFLQSSPQLYEFIKEDYPQIFAKIKKRIEEGRWEVTGGMWVEADCNIPSGESLVRQFLFGNRFMAEEFGLRCTILWLPDVFGYSWALPQIIKKSGLKYFMTTKISWSQYNRPEYDTFNWRGIDGTEVLTHFITTTESKTPRFYTYNGILNPKSAQFSWEHYQQKEINDELLLAYGWGDGGGGPTKEMLETGKKMQELPGIPSIRFGKAEPYFQRLEERVKDNPKLPIVDGELYLEYHRGTYTSQARIKRNNRKSEVLYHDLELFNSYASKKIVDFSYPQQKINQGWKIILRNQFHDILPGSSIHEVYSDSAEEFNQVLDNGQCLLGNSLGTIADNIQGGGERLVVFNSLAKERSGIVIIPWKDELRQKIFVAEEGEELPTKMSEEDGKKRLQIMVPLIPALGYRSFRIKERTEEAEQKRSGCLTATLERIENKYYLIKLNQKGQIASIYDKEAGREILPPNTVANLFQAFEDRPMDFDAWDIDIYYQEKDYIVDNLLSREIEEIGPDRVVLKFKWQFLDSVIEQKMIVYAAKRRIDFQTDVDWHEHQILLKTAFPVNVRATKATYEIQFGNVERPTHWNTSWDYAKFETVAQKWADLSERDYGASLLNDCKYGYDIKNNIMRLTLIKSGVNPDPEADQGEHSFTYSFYPHLGDWYTAETTWEAYDLNYPLLAVSGNYAGGSLPEKDSFLEIEAESTVLETVKKAEDDEGIILRFYEFANRCDQVKVKINSRIKDVLECNLMEEALTSIQSSDDSFKFRIKPYEIKTFKIKL